MNDGPGFLVNRLLLPYMNEAALLLCEGASIKDIERAAKSFGMPMGPFTLYDVVGIDVAVHAGRTMAAAFPDRVVAGADRREAFRTAAASARRPAKASSTTHPPKAANRRAAPIARKSPS